MIKINEDYFITTDPHNWILNESLPNHEGKRPQNPRQSYHPSLEKALIYIIDRIGKDNSSLHYILTSMGMIKDEIILAVKSPL